MGFEMQRIADWISRHCQSHPVARLEVLRNLSIFRASFNMLSANEMRGMVFKWSPQTIKPMRLMLRVCHDSYNWSWVTLIDYVWLTDRYKMCTKCYKPITIEQGTVCCILLLLMDLDGAHQPQEQHDETAAAEVWSRRGSNNIGRAKWRGRHVTDDP